MKKLVAIFLTGMLYLSCVTYVADESSSPKLSFYPPQFHSMSHQDSTLAPPPLSFSASDPE